MHLETAYYTLLYQIILVSTQRKYLRKKIIYGKLLKELRYGENPHQKAILYSKDNNIGLDQLSGKELSYNNYGDIFSSLSISKSLPKMLEQL